MFFIKLVVNGLKIFGKVRSAVVKELRGSYYKKYFLCPKNQAFGEPPLAPPAPKTKANIIRFFWPTNLSQLLPTEMFVTNLQKIGQKSRSLYNR